MYNIEVEGDHCYRVGQQGLLVHNASCPNEILWANSECALLPDDFKGTQYLGFDGHGRAKGVKARLCRGEHLGGGYEPSNKPGDSPRGWDEAGMSLLNRGDILVRFHLLHADLGGVGRAINLVVTCKDTNSQYYHEFEKPLIAWIEKGFTVDVIITVKYSETGNNPYPERIYAMAKRLDCAASTDKARCDTLPVGRKDGFPATTDITTCTGAIKR